MEYGRTALGERCDHLAGRVRSLLAEVDPELSEDRDRALRDAARALQQRVMQDHWIRSMTAGGASVEVAAGPDALQARLACPAEGAVATVRVAERGWWARARDTGMQPWADRLVERLRSALAADARAGGSA